MTYKVVISKSNKTFPIQGLNELLKAEEHIWNARAKRMIIKNKVKADNDKVCRLAIRRDLKGVKLKTPIRCIYYIYVKDKKHDRNNLESATTKSFLDALQQCGCIKSDGFDYVLDSIFHTDVCRENPRIEVIIEEVE